MNRLIAFIISIFFLTQCSLSEKINPSKDKKKKIENVKKIEKVLSDNKKIITEFNQDLKLDFSNIKTNNKINDNKNNFGFQNYDGLLNKLGNYKFAKLENINQLNFKPIFLNDGLIFLIKKEQLLDMLIIKKYYGKKIIILRQKKN